LRLLIVDPPAHGLDIAIRAQAAGHKVKLAVKPQEETKSIGQGFVEVIPDHRPWMRWADLVLYTDNTLYLLELERYRKEGGLVVGPTPEHAKWELNRQFGQEILRKHGITIAPSKTFSNYDQAIAYVKKTMGRFVSKPSGDGPADKALSYCSSGPDDMVYMLERWKKLNTLKGSFILQEFIPGIEMGVAGWFGPGGWNEGWEENWEFKKLMNGDKGVATGEQGTVLRYVKTSKLARKVLEPLTETLEKIGYVGDIDVNCIIDEEGTPWPLEFTTRLGWPAFNLQTALVQGDPVQWLLDLASGIDARPFSLNKICVGVVLSIPDYPYSHATKQETVGIPIYGVTENLWEHLHPCEMMMADAPVADQEKIIVSPMPATAGDYVLVMTGIADTVVEARDSTYRRLEKLDVPNSPMYRTDIGNRLRGQIPKLQEHGYATGMRYSTLQQS
jgi:phosphoribosylamine--glycine ligase